MEDILMTDEMYISLGFTKLDKSTQHTVYWEHNEHLVEKSNTINNEEYQKLISNPFKGNMFIEHKYHVSGNIYDSRLQIRVYPSAQSYRLIDVINGMNLFLKANYIEQGKEEIRFGIKTLLKLND